MPKRRVRTAAQTAASRRNLEKARKARALQEGRIPVGKTVTLVHRTSEDRAAKILKEQRFNPRQWGYGRPTSKKVYFTPASSKSGARFYGTVMGKSAVSVRVSRKVMKPDTMPGEYKYYGAVTVDVKDLHGIKIRRHY